MSELNDQQQIVVQGSGNLLIIAGPGTGKTHTITQKIAHLLQNKKVQANSIIAITFTNKAADQLEERVQKLLSSDQKAPFIGTFHALCLEILMYQKFKKRSPKGLEQAGSFSGFQIIPEKDRTKILQKLNEGLPIPLKAEDLKTTLRFISLAKNQLTDFKLLQNELGLPQASEALARHYEQYLRNHQLFDFDDLITQTLKLLQQNRPLQQKISEHLHYLFIDEYQDINEAQYQLIRLLIHPATQVCAIGDPDQAIYAFRGSNVEHFLRFEQDFPKTTVIALEKNYRSHNRIIQVANQLIQNNQKRVHKNLQAVNVEHTDIEIYDFENSSKEAHFIAKEISRLVGGIDMLQAHAGNTEEQVFTFTDMAIMYRTKSQGIALQNILKNYGIPTQIVPGIPWYETSEIQLLLSYFQLLAGEIPEVEHSKKGSDGEAAPRAPKEMIENLSDKKDREILENELLTGKILALSSELEKFTPSAIVKKIGELLNLENYYLQSGFMGEKKYQQVQMFQSSLIQFDVYQGRESLIRALNYYQTLQHNDNYDDRMQAVTLMTLHAAKGLEFPVVFITGLEDGILPLKKKSAPVNIEEERRLFYVGITRAKQKLYLSRAHSRNKKTQPPSPFIQEIHDLLLQKKIEAKKRKVPVEKQLSIEI